MFNNIPNFWYYVIAVVVIILMYKYNLEQEHMSPSYYTLGSPQNYTITAGRDGLQSDLSGFVRPPGMKTVDFIDKCIKICDNSIGCSGFVIDGSAYTTDTNIFPDDATRCWIKTGGDVANQTPNRTVFKKIQPK